MRCTQIHVAARSCKQSGEGRAGLTEPHPFSSLSSHDVARKWHVKPSLVRAREAAETTIFCLVMTENTDVLTISMLVIELSPGRTKAIDVQNMCCMPDQLA
jgi:hypothetical protein